MVISKIELVIEDLRFRKEILGSILTVSITPVRAHPNGELDIKANELLHKIQQSPASINGAWSFLFPSAWQRPDRQPPRPRQALVPRSSQCGLPTVLCQDEPARHSSARYSYNTYNSTFDPYTMDQPMVYIGHV